jgi:hypothetical protein
VKGFVPRGGWMPKLGALPSSTKMVSVAFIEPT